MTTLIVVIVSVIVAFVVATLIIEWVCEQEARGYYTQATKRERLKAPPRGKHPR